MLDRLLRYMKWKTKLNRWNRAEIEFDLAIIAGVGILILAFIWYLAVC